MKNEKWRMENGEWRMENGEWRMEAEKCRPPSLAPSPLIHPDLPSRCRILFVRCDLFERQVLGSVFPARVRVPSHRFCDGRFKIPGRGPSQHVEGLVGRQVQFGRFVRRIRVRAINPFSRDML